MQSSLVEVVERIPAVCAPHCGMGYGKLCALSLGDTLLPPQLYEGEKCMMHGIIFYVFIHRIPRTYHITHKETVRFAPFPTSVQWLTGAVSSQGATCARRGKRQRSTSKRRT